MGYIDRQLCPSKKENTWSIEAMSAELISNSKIIFKKAHMAWNPIIFHCSLCHLLKIRHGSHMKLGSLYESSTNFVSVPGNDKCPPRVSFFLAKVKREELKYFKNNCSAVNSLSWKG